jgi:phospholipase C
MPGPIEHVIAVMFENRSFDHILGFTLDGPRGLRPTPAAPVPVNRDPETGVEWPATRGIFGQDFDHDCGHEPADVAEQLTGTQQAGPVTPAQVNASGFIANFRRRTPVAPERIMRCFGPGELPAFHTLAAEFGLCASWFSAVPGPTWPNRLFFHAGTSAGMAKSPSTGEVIWHTIGDAYYTPTTVFAWLEEHGLRWTIYEHQLSQSRALAPVHKLNPDPRNDFVPFDSLLDDLRAGSARLPNYAFVEPAWRGNGQNDMHPNPGADFRRANNLLATIYNAVRRSPAWERILLLVLFDEHGGIFDHVHPGPTIPPDGKPSNDPCVDFRMLGLRVPALLISPRIARGVVDTPFNHCSLIRSLADIFAIPLVPALGDRTPLAASFAGLVGGVRTDVPDHVDTTTVDDTRYDPASPLDDNQRLLVAQSLALSHPATPEIRVTARRLPMAAMRAEPSIAQHVAALARMADQARSVGDAERLLRGR